MKRTIKKVAVLGSGVMGSRIACHFANIGLEVILLDMVPHQLTDAEKAKGKTLKDQEVRNRVVNDSLRFALQSNPSPIYRKSFAKQITTGNFDDNLAAIQTCDWIIEAIIENLDIKKRLFEKVEQHRTPGTLITSNTSGIPIRMMTDGRSEDFRKNFCGTHFFNPPRYLKLLEIIPTPETDPDVVHFFMDYGARFLGKTTVLCKDTPAFIANRIGVYSMVALFHLVKEMNLTVDEVDKLSGPVLGRPKSATFRTCDVVGLDTLVHVANGLKANTPHDEANALFALPDYISAMVNNNWLGSKTQQGFYKKVKDENGKSQILSLDLATLKYAPKQKVKFATLETTKSVDNLKKRTKMLYNGKDRAGEFYQRSFHGLFAYVSNRIPEITDTLYKIDDAMEAGFGWELGPFAAWDAIGVREAISGMEAAGKKPAQWVYNMLESGAATFYKVTDGVKYFWDFETGKYQVIPGQEDLIVLENIRKTGTLWSNSDCTLVDLGDGVIHLEWSTKMNTIGGAVIQGIQKAIDLAEKEYKALVISNDGENFSAGANVGMIFMLAVEQEWDELNFAIQAFQNTMMRVRYSSVPVIVAPHGMTLGGGCELCLHADKVVANAETYMGLVEFGVGLIPGGGGTKEFVLRHADALQEGDVEINAFRNRFLTIGQAKVSASASEAFDLGYLREGKDEAVVSRAHQLARAKASALSMVEKGYTRPVERKDIRVPGQQGLGIVYVGANSMLSGHYISEHDAYISEKLGFVMCGGDLSEPTLVSERYLLQLEREAFLHLCSKRKTLERIESILKTGKVLRN